MSGRTNLQSLQPTSKRVRDLFASFSRCETVTNDVLSNGVETTRFAMLSLHLAMDCAKDYGLVNNTIYVAQMLELYANVTKCRAFVNIQRWLLYDGPALATHIFQPVLNGQRPQAINVPWLDSVASAIFDVLFKYSQDGRHAATERGEAEIDVPVHATTDVVDEPEEWIDPGQLRRSARIAKNQEQPINFADDDDDGEDDVIGEALARLDEDSDSEYSDDGSESTATLPLSSPPSPPSATSARPQRLTLPQPALPRPILQLTAPAALGGSTPSIRAPLRRRKFKLLFQGFGTGRHKLYKALVRTLIETLFELLMAPGLRRGALLLGIPDTVHKTTKSNGTATEKLIGLVVSSGWLLEVLAHAAGGDHIWASPELRRIYLAARTYCPTYADNYTRLYHALSHALAEGHMGDTQIVLPPDLAAMWSAIHGWFRDDANPTPLRISEFGQAFRFQVDELRRNELSEAPTAHVDVTASVTTVATRARHKAVNKAILPTRVGASPDDLHALPSASTFAPYALMLCLAFDRELRVLDSSAAPSLHSEDEAAEAFFTGSNIAGATLSQSRFTPDQLNPVPAFWTMTKMFDQYFTRDNIRQPHVFKNFVTAIATGQSLPTKQFFDTWMTKMPSTERELQDLVSHRENANADAQSEHPTRGPTWLARNSEYQQTHNMLAYGAACKEFSFRDGQTISDIWAAVNGSQPAPPALSTASGDQSSSSATSLPDSPGVPTSAAADAANNDRTTRVTIHAWLVDFLTRNPRPQEQVSWSEMAKEIDKWNISPFKGDSLSGLHLRNRLAHLGMCRPATVVEIGQWIAGHRSLGAFAGLRVLGFGPLDTTNNVVHAVQMVYDHFDENTTAAQKDVLRFNAAMVENFLCKVSRVTKVHAAFRIPEPMDTWGQRYLTRPHLLAIDHWDPVRRVSNCNLYSP